MYYQRKDQHQAVKSKNFGEHNKAKVLWTLKEAKGKGIVLRRGNQNEIPIEIGRLGNQFKEPDGCPGRRSEPYRAKMWIGIISNERGVKFT